MIWKTYIFNYAQLTFSPTLNILGMSTKKDISYFNCVMLG